ncbi:MAG: class I SAM-dependent methyltransferase [Lachnospiraceae bacterium]|nr:class I SAM-dependent methyltransferase [Lachnospiraceae bacterium]
MNKLSKRLTMLCGMVKKGSRVVDVGCDHGFVPIFLVQSGLCPHVLAMDVGSGPLSGAREHIAELGLNDYIDTRLSDGLENYRRGEADVLVCAGMGGRLMLRILSEAGEKLEDFSELLLQPQSELFEFRNKLRMGGYYITDEEMVFEGGKYYFIMKAVHSKENAGEDGEMYAGVSVGELYDRYGEWNIKKSSPVLINFLTETLEARTELEQSLLKKGGTRAEARLDGLSHEICCIRAALGIMGET